MATFVLVHGGWSLLGGDETTRHVISGGMEQLLLDPGERSLLEDEPALLPSAVEEMLRWVSPIKNMARTVTRDVELGAVRELPVRFTATAPATPYA